MKLPDWVQLPSTWIEAGGLKQLRWSTGGLGSASAAGLMALAAIAHRSQEGFARATYDELCEATSLSRSKLSEGLDVLADINVLDRGFGKRSEYRLAGFDPRAGWAKLPARSLYRGGRIRAFEDFRLRSPTELHALKLYFLFATRRSSSTNIAKISFDKIETYTAIPRHKIKAGISLLASEGLIYVEHYRSSIHEAGLASGYRLVGLESYVHMGTTGRDLDIFEPDAALGA